MSDEFLPFAKPSISQDAINEVLACLESGWITSGPRLETFKNKLKEYLQCPYIVVVNSATAGLFLSLKSLNLQPGDEVITTPLTFVATLNTIALANAKPVLVDIDPNTLNIDPHLIERAITKRTRAIMPVHFAGLPADLDTIYQLAEKHGLRVIEDAAHALGAHYHDRIIGSFGDTQVFSFHPTKNITTAEGGCIATHDKELAEFANCYANHGISRNAWDRYTKKGSQQFDVIMPGFKFNLTDIQAAIGMHQIDRLDEFNYRRHQLVNSYQDILHEWPQFEIPKIPGFSHKHAWHIYTPLINPTAAGIDRDTFIKKMNEQNVGIGLHYRPAHLYQYYRQQFGYNPGDFPIAEDVGARICSLPLCPSLTHQEQDRVIAAMIKVFGENA